MYFISDNIATEPQSSKEPLKIKQKLHERARSENGKSDRAIRILEPNNTKTIVSKYSRIPIRHHNQIIPDIKNTVKKLEGTVDQLKRLKISTGQILQESSNHGSMNSKDDKWRIKDFKGQIADLNIQCNLLQEKLKKEQEKGRMHSKVTSIVPTSLEVQFLFEIFQANIHLRYQFQTGMEKERKKYKLLLLENEKLASEVKQSALTNCTPIFNL